MIRTEPVPWLLWDGDCGFCSRCAGWVERHDRDDRVRVQAYQDAPSPPITPEIRDAAARAVQYVYPDGHFVSGSRAVFATLRRIGYPGPWRVLSWPPLVWIAELGYRIVARNREFFARILFRGETPACRVSPEAGKDQGQGPAT